VSAIAYSRFTNEILAMAKDQGCKVTFKEHHGVLLQLPNSQTVFFHDPGKESHAQKIIEKRLRSAGFKLDTDTEESTVSSIMTPKPNGAHTANGPPLTIEVSPFARARQKINQAVGLLSEIEQELAAIEKDSGKMQTLKELLKTL
jgi:hypothetical protein